MVTLHDDAIIIGDSSHRHKDENGHLIVKDNPIATQGVYPFLRGSIDPSCPEAEKGQVVQVFRSAQSLQDAYPLFKDKPIVHKHTWVGSGGDRGTADGHVSSNVYYRDGTIYGDLIIYNPSLITAIEDGTCTQLSAGYSATVSPDQGVHEDQSYSHSILYSSVNHLGVVPQGRAGVKLSIRDSQDKEMDTTMDSNEVRSNHKHSKGMRGFDSSPAKESATADVKKEETPQGHQGSPHQTTQHQDTLTGGGKRSPHHHGGHGHQGRRQVYKRCLDKMKRGEMSQEDMRFVMDNFGKGNSGSGRRARPHQSTARSPEDTEPLAARQQDAAQRAQEIQAAIAEINQHLPAFKALDDAPAAIHYSRAYTLLTKERVQDGLDPRTAFLMQAKAHTAHAHTPTHTTPSHAPSNSKVVDAIDAFYQDNAHKHRSLSSLFTGGK